MNLKKSTSENVLKLKLAEIATANFGPYIKEVDEKGVMHLQVKNFSESGKFLNNVDFYVNEEKVNEKQLLKHDDILFVSKGFKYFAFRYDSSMGPAIASSIFYILKIDKSKANPRYVECILNHPKTIQFFMNASAGTSIPSIRKGELMDFEIPLPNLETQKIIADLYALHKTEMDLIEILKEKKKQFFNQSIINLTK